MTHTHKEIRDAIAAAREALTLLQEASLDFVDAGETLGEAINNTASSYAKVFAGSFDELPIMEYLDELDEKFCELAQSELTRELIRITEQLEEVTFND